MIIEPDFLDHWKTRLLMRLLNTEAAPNYVIRLWSHCQTRKTNKFPEWSPEILASVCRWPGDADQFWSAMMQTFCRSEDGHLIAHEWDEVNASLIAAWSNGGKGGRPKKPTGNPRVNLESNQVNPQLTHGVTDREEKIEKTEKTLAPKSPWEVKFGLILPEKLQTDECLTAVETWMAYKAERKQGYKRIGLSKALEAWANEFNASTFPAAVNHSIANNYQGIFAPRGALASGAGVSPAARTLSYNPADYQ
jgi:hypothetical protein